VVERKRSTGLYSVPFESSTTKFVRCDLPKPTSDEPPYLRLRCKSSDRLDRVFRRELGVQIDEHKSAFSLISLEVVDAIGLTFSRPMTPSGLVTANMVA